MGHIMSEENCLIIFLFCLFLKTHNMGDFKFIQLFVTHVSHKVDGKIHI